MMLLQVDDKAAIENLRTHYARSGFTAEVLGDSAMLWVTRHLRDEASIEP